jgi:hypothetical protein
MIDWNPSLRLCACSLLFTALVASAQLPASSAPVPRPIRAAHSIFVSNAGSDSGLFPEPFSGTTARPYEELYAVLKSSGKYDLVDTPDEADLVLEIRLTGPNGPQNPSKQLGAADPRPMVRLVVYDQKTHYILWAFTESVGWAILQKSHDKNLDDAIQSVAAQFEQLSGRLP